MNEHKIATDVISGFSAVCGERLDVIWGPVIYRVRVRSVLCVWEALNSGHWPFAVVMFVAKYLKYSNIS